MKSILSSLVFFVSFINFAQDFNTTHSEIFSYNIDGNSGKMEFKCELNARINSIDSKFGDPNYKVVAKLLDYSGCPPVNTDISIDFYQGSLKVATHTFQTVVSVDMRTGTTWEKLMPGVSIERKKEIFQQGYTIKNVRIAKTGFSASDCRSTVSGTTNSTAQSNSSSSVRSASSLAEVRAREQAAKAAKSQTSAQQSAESLHQQQVKATRSKTTAQAQSQSSSSTNTRSTIDQGRLAAAQQNYRAQQDLAREMERRRLADLQRQARNTQNTLDFYSDLYNPNNLQQQWANEENFQSRKSRLTKLNAQSGRQLLSEYSQKSRQLERLYQDRDQQVNREYQQMTQKLVNSAENDAQAALGAAIGAMAQASARKQVEKEKRQAQAKLRRQKEQEMKRLADNLERRFRPLSQSALDNAAVAIDPQEEAYYLDQYKYFDCVMRNSYAAAAGSTSCRQPSSRQFSAKAYSAEDYYKAYERKRFSQYNELKKEANYFLELVLSKSPNNAKWLYEKAKLSTKTTEKLGLLAKAAQLQPENKTYQNALRKAEIDQRAEVGQQGKLVNKKKEGQWKYFWDNGELQQVVSYQNDRPTSDLLIYYDEDWKPTRQKSKAKYFRMLTYDAQGNWNSKATNHYIDGTLQMEAVFTSEFKAKEDVSGDPTAYADGPVKLYYPNGNIKQIFTIKSYQYNGKVIDYYKNGQKKAIVIYKDGQPYESFGHWSESGQAIDGGNLAGGNGTLKIFDEETNKYKGAITYVNSKRTEVTSIDKDNNLRYVSYESNGDRRQLLVYYGPTTAQVKSIYLYKSGALVQKFNFSRQGKKQSAYIIKDNKVIFNFDTTTSENFHYTKLVFNSIYPDGILKQLAAYPSWKSYTRTYTLASGAKRKVSVKKAYEVYDFNASGQVISVSFYKLRNNKLVERINLQ